MVVGQDFLVILVRVNQGLVQVFPQVFFTSGGADRALSKAASSPVRRARGLGKDEERCIGVSRLKFAATPPTIYGRRTHRRHGTRVCLIIMV